MKRSALKNMLLIAFTMNVMLIGNVWGGNKGRKFVDDHVLDSLSNAYDKSIRTNRMAEFALRIDPSWKKELSGKSLQIRLIEHEYIFGGTLFPFLFDYNSDAEAKKRALAYANQNFNWIVDGNGFKWKFLESQTTPPFFHHRMIEEWANRNGKKSRHHCLFWTNPEQNPEYVQNLSGETLYRELGKRLNAVKNSVWAKEIQSLDVVNEMLFFDFYQKRIGGNVVKRLYQEAHKAFPAARLYLNENPFQNKHGWDGFDRYQDLIRKFQKDSIPFHGVGLQAHYDLKTLMSSGLTVDEFLTQLDQAISQLSKVAKFPVLVTEYDMIADNPEHRARFLQLYYKMIFANPNTEGILAWAWIDIGQKSGYVNKNGKITKEGEAYSELMKQWTIQEKQTWDGSSELKFQGYFGTYLIEIGNRSFKVEFPRSGSRAKTVGTP